MSSLEHVDVITKDKPLSPIHDCDALAGAVENPPRTRLALAQMSFSLAGMSHIANVCQEERRFQVANATKGDLCIED